MGWTETNVDGIAFYVISKKVIIALLISGREVAANVCITCFIIDNLKVGLKSNIQCWALQGL